MHDDSGLGHLLAVIAGSEPAQSMAATLNFSLTEAVRGAVAFRGKPTEAMLNPFGTVHGGWSGAILDSAMGCAVQSVLGPGDGFFTLEYKVNMTRPIPIGAEVEARAQVQHGGRRIAVASGEVRGVADNRLYATGTTTCMVSAGRA